MDVDELRCCGHIGDDGWRGSHRRAFLRHTGLCQMPRDLWQSETLIRETTFYDRSALGLTVRVVVVAILRKRKGFQDAAQILSPRG